MLFRIDQRHRAEDRALVQRFKAHPAPSPERDRAFGELLTRHRRLVLSYCRRRVDDPGLAEDVAQQVFLALWNGLDRMENPDGLHSWLRTVTHHQCTAQFAGPAQDRRPHRRLRPPEVLASHDQALFENAATVGEEEDSVLLALQVDQLGAVLDRFAGALPPRLQPVYRLHVREGWDGEELKRRLGVPDATMRRFKSDLLTEELARLLVTNLVAAEALDRGREASCGRLLDLLGERRSDEPLTRSLVLKVDKHLRQCTACEVREQHFRQEWRRTLPLLVSSGLHEPESDHIELTAAAHDLGQGGHQPPTGTVRRTGRRLAVALVVLLGTLAGGMAWQADDGRSADTVLAGPDAPGSSDGRPRSGSAPDTGSSSPHSPDSGDGGGDGDRGAGSSAGKKTTPDGSNPSNHGKGGKDEKDGKGGVDGNDRDDGDAGGSGDRIGTGPSANPGANPGDGTSPSAPGETAPSPGPDPAPDPPPAELPPPPPAPAPPSSAPAPPAPHKLVVHLNAPSAGGVSVAVNGAGVGTCSKAYEAPAKDCAYTVHVGDTVRLAPLDSLVTWGAPCAGGAPEALCEFLVAGDVTTNLTTSYNPG
ncbi:sigma-70 family RNA polymerase sigma factor [Streptomyces sp900129855]|uniref:Sigma-70 family RNA polymerase sigma factor n=1 Tax=Streptomyces sp. 900129855 TaxID=3155129 RepID=A0ABV2ZC38_9ACTN